MSDVIRLLDLRDEPLSVDEVYRAVADPSAGGIVLFVGTVRDHDGGHGVDALAYSAHPTVLEQMRAVADGVVERYDVVSSPRCTGSVTWVSVTSPSSWPWPPSTAVGRSRRAGR